MLLGLRGKTALVLSSSQGLGLGVATMLADEGANVVLTGRRGDRLAAEAARINERGAGRAIYLAADIGHAETPARLLAAGEQDFGVVDILVNNTGGPAPGPASAVDTATWAGEFAKMALPVFEMTRLALPGMRARKWGRVVTIASSGIVQPIPNLAVSNALRSSLASWMKTLSFEVAPDGVTVNMVVPGRIGTERTAQLDGDAAARTGKPLDEVVKASLATIPVGRYGRVEEFASVVTFLAGQLASYVTGATIRADGGMIRSL